MSFAIATGGRYSSVLIRPAVRILPYSPHLGITTGDGQAILETDKLDQMKLRAAPQPAQTLVRDRRLQSGWDQADVRRPDLEPVGACPIGGAVRVARIVLQPAAIASIQTGT